MNQFRQLLIIIDEQNFTLKAVFRAIDFARKTHGKITVVLLNHNYLLHQMLALVSHRHHPETLLSYEQKLQQLENCMANIYENLHVQVDAFSILDTPKQVLTLIQEQQVDAVFVAASRHDWWQAIDALPIDKYLMRESSASVYVVKENHWHQKGHIVSAVQAFSEDALHQQLSEQILEETSYLAKLFDKECHIVDCFEDDSNSMSFRHNVDGKSEDNKHQKAINQLCHRFHVPDNHVHLDHTVLPEFAIDAVSHDFTSDLIIIGHSGSHSIKSHVLGHTAEEVLDIVACDLLVMKPPFTTAPQQHL